jgi:sirohydrochlorin ferrochelatase
VTVLACSHGTSSPTGRAAVAGLVAAVAAARPSTRVEAAFVDVEDPDVPTALASLAGEAGAARPFRVVPLLLSAGFHVYVDLTESAAGEPGSVLCPAMGPDDRLVTVLVRRLHEVGLEEGDAVVLAAAGSSDGRAVADCERTAAMLSDRIGGDVLVGYISAALPRLEDAVAAARIPGSRVVVATYLLAPGYFADLARDSGADVVTAPLLDGGPPPTEIVELVWDRADLAGSGVG